MARHSLAETLVGAAVLVLAAAFVIYAVGMRGSTAGSGSYELSAEFRSVEGLAIGTDVRLAGIRVGAVDALALDPDSFRATARFSVRDDLRLPEDSAVRVASEGLLGGAYLELTPGSSAFELEPGAQVAASSATDNLIETLRRLGNLR